MVLAQTGTSRQAGNGDFFLRSSGKALLTKINKGIIWWISSVRKPLTDIHVTVVISDKGDVLENKCVPAPMSLAFALFKGCFVLYSIRPAHRQYRRFCRWQPAKCRGFLTSPRGTISTHRDRHDKEAFIPLGHRSGAKCLRHGRRL